MVSHDLLGWLRNVSLRCVALHFLPAYDLVWLEAKIFRTLLLALNVMGF